MRVHHRPAHNLVQLPDRVSFEEGARFGYPGTAYAGLRKAGAESDKTILINVHRRARSTA